MYEIFGQVCSILVETFLSHLFVFLEIKTGEGVIDGAHMVNCCHLLTLCGDI